MTPASASAADLARRLAAARPDIKLPCPICAASLNAANMDKHLRKVHVLPAAQMAHPDIVSWRGKDHAMTPVVLVLLLLGMVAIGVGAAVQGQLRDELAFAAAAVVGVPLLLLVLAGSGVFPARLSLDGHRLRLRYFWGLLGKSVRLPAPIEVGGLTKRRPSAITSSYAADYDGGLGHDTVKAGVYLCIGGIAVGSNKGTAFRKHWDPSGWKAAGKRKRWHITLPRESVVQLEYHLAARGYLAPRS